MYVQQGVCRGIKKVDFPEVIELGLIKGHISVTAETIPLTAADRVRGMRSLQRMTTGWHQKGCRMVKNIRRFVILLW